MRTSASFERAAAAAIAISLFACGHEVQKEPVVVTPPPPAQSTDVGSGGDASAPAHAVPAAFRGPFHLPGHVDSINLVLEDDGTFRWRIFGCDFSGGGEGVWKFDGAAMILTPRGPSFPWMDDASFAHAAAKVTLRPRADGGLDAEATGASAASDVWRQTWSHGRVCAQCGGGLGPDKMPKACNQPIPPAGASFGE